MPRGLFISTLKLICICRIMALVITCAITDKRLISIILYSVLKLQQHIFSRTRRKRTEIMNSLIFTVIAIVIYILVTYISVHLKDSMYTRNFYLGHATIFGSTCYTNDDRKFEFITPLLKLPPTYKTMTEFSMRGYDFVTSFLQVLFPLLRKGIRRRLLAPFLRMLVMMFKFVEPLQDALLLLKHTARYDLGLRVEFLDDNLDDSDDE